MRSLASARRLSLIGRPALLTALGLVCAWALASRPPDQALSLLLVGGAALLAWLRADWGLCWLAFAVPYDDLLTVSLGPGRLGVSELLMAALLAGLVLRGVVDRQRALVLPPVLWALAAFIALAALSLPGAAALGLGLKEVVRWLEFGLVVLLSANLAGSPRVQRRLLLVLVLAALSQALLGLAQVFGGQALPSYFVGNVVRASGSFGQPNPYGGYLALGLVVAYSLWLIPWRSEKPPCPAERSEASVSRGQRDGPSAALRVTAVVAEPRARRVSLSRQGWLWPGAALVIAAALVISQSRGALSGAAAGVLVVSLFGGRRGLIIIGGIVILAGGVLSLGTVRLLPAAIADRLLAVGDFFGVADPTGIKVTDENFALVQRLVIWRTAIDLARARPWTGIGWGNFPSGYPAVAPAFWAQFPPEHAHNYYLTLAAETGLLGLAGHLIWAIGCVWAFLARIVRSARVIVAAGLGTLAAFLVHNLSDVLAVHSIPLIIALLLGMTLAARQTVRA